MIDRGIPELVHWIREVRRGTNSFFLFLQVECPYNPTKLLDCVDISWLIRVPSKSYLLFGSILTDGADLRTESTSGLSHSQLQTIWTVDLRTTLRCFYRTIGSCKIKTDGDHPIEPKQKLCKVVSLETRRGEKICRIHLVTKKDIKINRYRGKKGIFWCKYVFTYF